MRLVNCEMTDCLINQRICFIIKTSHYSIHVQPSSRTQENSLIVILEMMGELLFLVQNYYFDIYPHPVL